MTRGHLILAVLIGAPVALLFWLVSQLRTGDADQDSILWATAAGVLWALHPITPAQIGHARDVARALVLIAGQERSFGGAIGDQGIASGPSISPFQILRTTAIADGVVSSDTDAATYGAMATTGPALVLWAKRAAQIFESDFLLRAGGDFGKAIELWNGPSSTGYEGGALAQAGNLNWTLPGSSPGATV